MTLFEALAQSNGTTEFWFQSRAESIREIIHENLTPKASGRGNRARRRIAHLHRFLEIRSRTISKMDGLGHAYYFTTGLDIPGGASVMAATDSREFRCGDIVEIDTAVQRPESSGWGKIVRLVSDANRRNDTHWFLDRVDTETAERFSLPDAPVNPMPLTSIRRWRNNADAELILEFTPAHWNVMSGHHLEVHPPSLRFVSLNVTRENSMVPNGYMHDAGEVPFHAISPIFVQDDFTRRLDEFFVARWWAGENRSFGTISMPGIGASLQSLYFDRPPHEILEGTDRKVFYA